MEHWQLKRNVAKMAWTALQWLQASLAVLPFVADTLKNE